MGETASPRDLLLAYDLADEQSFEGGAGFRACATGVLGGTEDPDGYYDDFTARLDDFVKAYPRLGGHASRRDAEQGSFAGDPAGLAGGGLDWGALVVPIAEGGAGGAGDEGDDTETEDWEASTEDEDWGACDEDDEWGGWRRGAPVQAGASGQEAPLRGGFASYIVSARGGPSSEVRVPAAGLGAEPGPLMDEVPALRPVSVLGDSFVVSAREDPSSGGRGPDTGRDPSHPPVLGACCGGAAAAPVALGDFVVEAAPPVVMRFGGADGWGAGAPPHGDEASGELGGAEMDETSAELPTFVETE